MSDLSTPLQSKTNLLNSAANNFSYDNMYQLTGVTGSNPESYTYDSVGNRLTSQTVASYTYYSSNELASTSNASYTYDDNGNMRTKTDSNGTTTYNWDFENRLTSVQLPNSSAVNFKYDPFGRRIQKSGTSTTNYVYDGSSSAEEVDQNGVVLARYTQGQEIDEALSEFRSGTSSYYEQDGLDSVTSLSTIGGTLANTYVYDSFGNTTTSTGTLINPYQYTGRDYDAETGLRYYRARYYDPSSGRFLSEDPAGIVGSENLYAYTGNDPVDWIDPSGLKMTPAQCKELRRQIKYLSIKLAKELAKYDPVDDGQGGWPMKWGSGKTKPGGHYQEMGHYAAGILNNLALYYKECRDCDDNKKINPRIPDEVLEPLQDYKKAPKPVLVPFVVPITAGELALREQSAQYMEQFWRTILLGDIALGIVGTGGALGGFGGAGAKVLAPAFGW